MDTATHAFVDSREATTYTVLQRVLQNHCTTHVLSLLAALTAAVLLLVGTCMQRCEAGGVEEGTLLRQTLAGLKQRVRTRPARVPLSLLAEPDYVDPHDPREGVSKVLICYPRYEDERQRNSNTRECSHGSSSTSLLLLSRHGYCAPWHDAARQATVSLSAVPRRARAHISPGI